MGISASTFLRFRRAILLVFLAFRAHPGGRFESSPKAPDANSLQKFCAAKSQETRLFCLCEARRAMSEVAKPIATFLRLW